MQRLLGLTRLVTRASSTGGVASPVVTGQASPGSIPARVAHAHEEEEEVPVYAKVRNGGAWQSWTGQGKGRIFGAILK